MDKNINNNGYDYVDLDLPSGTLWATKNVGASSPSDYGWYFQWGDPIGYAKKQIGNGSKKKAFSAYINDYKFGINGNSSIFSKYTTEGETLKLEDDGANFNMGGDWHIPSPTQIKELLDNTTKVWKTSDSVSGMEFTSKKDASKSIFIPAAGYAWCGLLNYCKRYCYTWSSAIGTDNVSCSQYLFFGSGTSHLSNSGDRRCGFPIRGVIDKNDDNSKENKSNMNDNLNLIEILKDAPKGTKLYSPICGECKLVEIAGDIKCEALEDGCCWKFRSDGSFAIYKDAECLLFPSKENRDWSSFKTSKKHKEFKPYQKVLVKELVGRHFEKSVWLATEYSYYDEDLKKHYCTQCYGFDDDEIIPYEGNEDKLGKKAER